MLGAQVIMRQSFDVKTKGPPPNTWNEDVRGRRKGSRFVAASVLLMIALCNCTGWVGRLFLMAFEVDTD